MKNLVFILIIFGFLGSSFIIKKIQPNNSSNTITFSEHIAPIFYTNCTGCHHSGGVGPFSLINYQESYNMRNAIQASVLSGYMPPWPPDTNYSRFRHERILSSQEINLINDWISLGAPQGNPNLAPTPPTYNTTGPQLGVPDLTIQAPTYSSNAFQDDDYVCFTIPSQLLNDKKIRAVEVVPGNTSIVHHCLVYIDPSGSSAIGIENNCMGPNNGVLVGEFAPGSLPITYPGDENMAFGMNLPANSNVILAMHYPIGSLGMLDSTQVHFYFYPDQVTQFREIEINPIVQNFSFCVPANQTKTVQDSYQLPNFSTDLSLFGVFPHMHLIGKSIETYGINQNGDTTNFVKVPDWDFEWQGAYHFNKMKKLDAGSTIKSIALYDNTSANLHNPNTPPQTICAGFNTTDEMFVIYYLFTDYMTGDENLNLDSLTLSGLTSDKLNYSTNNSFLAYPNPTSGLFTIKTNWPYNEVDRVEFYNIQGKLTYIDKVESSINNPFKNSYNFKNIILGKENKIYFIRIHHKNGNVRYSKIVLN
jgi:hypothetical protein